MVTTSKKQALRTSAFEMRQTLLDLDGGRKFASLSKKLGENIERECSQRGVSKVFSFFPSKGEPDFSTIFFGKSLRWFFPKVKDTSMTFHECKSFDDLKSGAFGIFEPIDDKTSVIPTKDDIILVPGLLFDGQGHRLGYGKGFYDRFFEKFNSAFKIGIAFDDFIVQRLPHELFDLPVDAIITETKCITVKS